MRHADIWRSVLNTFAQFIVPGRHSAILSKLPLRGARRNDPQPDERNAIRDSRNDALSFVIPPHPPLSFRDAPSSAIADEGAGPESITTIGRMDSGLVHSAPDGAECTPRNDRRGDVEEKIHITN
ncbi:hypothetical protein V1282_001977 [Nitrobacteraceae bacterium AZCC 2146]